jgi:hypothetical protein
LFSIRWDMQRQRAEQERLKLLKVRRSTNPVSSCSSNNKSVISNKNMLDEENGNVSLTAQSSHSMTPAKLANEKQRINKKNAKSIDQEIYYKEPDQVNLDGKFVILF